MKKAALAAWVLVFSMSSAGCALGGPVQAQPTIQRVASDGSPAAQLVYQNTKYGFDFYLPLSWQGFTIVPGQWEGLAIGGSEKGGPVETGPIIAIRHPKWTAQAPRQDIPIMVFTLAQWQALQAGKFHIGAAPIGPSELGRNARYVFALPARYNYAFLPGYEEVEQILAGKPLQPSEPQ